ncbi:MAG: MBL fold metallo-hydrolase [Proteobacteria bacterium]|nr:MBL fold metallo-hydrolase [Pseudomonadota bacterium]
MLTGKIGQLMVNTTAETDHIHLLGISTPFPVGKVNVYLIEDEIPTLVDTPPKGAVYINELQAALNGKGYSIKDIKRIIITHPHFDHCGAAAEIVRLSGAEVWTSRGGARYLEHFNDEFSMELQYYMEIFRQAGVPGNPRTYLEHLYDWARAYSCIVTVSRFLEDGDEFMLGSAPYSVKAVPGHSPWCILLYSQDRTSAFSGDFLLKDISSNALIQRPGSAQHEYKSLKSYLASLQEVKKMAIQKALPGHGEIIEDVAGRIDEIITFIRQRQKLVRDILDRGPCRAFSIVQALFPDLQGEQLFLGISEVIGHLELLESDGIVLQREDGYWVVP